GIRQRRHDTRIFVEAASIEIAARKHAVARCLDPQRARKSTVLRIGDRREVDQIAAVHETRARAWLRQCSLLRRKAAYHVVHGVAFFDKFAVREVGARWRPAICVRPRNTMNSGDGATAGLKKNFSSRDAFRPSPPSSLSPTRHRAKRGAAARSSQD